MDIMDWEINEQTVRNLMPYIRSKDLAYENSLSSESIASELCDSFLSIFAGLVMIDKKNRHDVGRRCVCKITSMVLMGFFFDS